MVNKKIVTLSTLGVNVVKLFFFITDTFQNKLECLLMEKISLGKYLQVSWGLHIDWLTEKNLIGKTVTLLKYYISMA